MTEADTAERPADLAPVLSTEEQTILAECERRIERGLKTFVEVGEALAEIRDQRLYRASHGSFEAYAQERWGLSRPRAYQLVDAAGTVSTIVDSGLPAPENEGQARELARVPVEQRAQVWEQTLEHTGGKPTAAAIRDTYQRSVDQPPAENLAGDIECGVCGEGGFSRTPYHCATCDGHWPVPENGSNVCPRDGCGGPGITTLPGVDCEQCGKQLPLGEVRAGLMRCEKCDPAGDHETVPGYRARCKVCDPLPVDPPPDPAAAAAAAVAAESEEDPLSDPPVYCEKCGAHLKTDLVGRYFVSTRCQECDPDGDHRRIDPKVDGCVVCDPRAALPEELRETYDRLRAGDAIVSHGDFTGSPGWMLRLALDLADANSLVKHISGVSTHAWGNPFTSPDDGDPDTVLAAYRDHFLAHKPSLLKQLPNLRGKILECYGGRDGADHVCHGPVLVEAAAAAGYLADDADTGEAADSPGGERG